MTPRLVVMCIDGGDEDVVRSLVAAGRLPTFKRLLASGSAIKVDTSCDELDLLAWPALLSGQPPGNHGLAHFLEFDPPTLGLRIRRESDLEPWWLHLPRHGEGVVALDAPEMHPHPASQAEEACGWHGYSSMHKAAINSRRLRHALRALGRPPKLDDPHAVATPGEEDAVASNLVRSVAFQASAAAAVAGDAHTLCLGFHQPHAVVHWFGHHQFPDHWHRPGPARPELVSAPYEALDRAVGRVAAAFAGANFAIVLARGTRPNNQCADLVDELLQRAGIQRRIGPAVSSLTTPEPGATATGHAGIRGLIPADLRERVATTLLPTSVQQRLMSRTFAASLDWERTRAFAVPSWDCGLIRVNLAGREAHGSVAPADRETVLAEVTGLLGELTDTETGQPLVAEIIRAQERYPGSRAELLPDLVVKFGGTRPALRASHPRFGTWGASFREGRWTEHKRSALVLLSGPSVHTSENADERDLLGVAPTLLSLRGARRPSVMVGDAWADLVRSP